MITEYIDTTIDPRNDFYDYACGGWQKSHPLKPEYSRYGVFDLIRDKSLIQIKELIENLENSPETAVSGSISQKINDIYRLGMDMDRRNKEGATPILPIVERIQNLSRDNLDETFAWLHRGAGGGFFGFGVGADPDDADMNILHVSECGLMLDDRDYYLEKNERNDEILKAFKDYVLKIMQLTGYSPEDAFRVWESVIEIETEIARHKKTREERRNPLLSYNKMSLEDFIQKYDAIDWKSVFGGAGLELPEDLNVISPAFIEFINSYIPSLELQKIKDYLVFTAIAEATGTLSEDYQKADFELYGRIMSGREEMKPLWKRVMGIPNSMFGEAVGQLYVEKYFPAESKTYMMNLVENLRNALKTHISNLDWMSEETKEKALIKLSDLKVKIGYPDKWKDYSEITIDPKKSFHANVLAASEWFIQDGYSKLGKPVDKDEWFMTPQTVNAYYHPTMNEICFPAAILQSPYFDKDAPEASNYGAIGVVIGHEMTHGFDDQGRRFDAAGNLNDWWTKEDEERFNSLTDKLVDQFDAIEVAPGVHANGRFTLGENIADQGGLRIALTAYGKALNIENPEENLTDEQLRDFYLAYASVWASNIRPEDILSRTKTDPHSLEKNRVNETLKNITPFSRAFNIKEGDKMYRLPKDRVVIW